MPYQIWTQDQRPQLIMEGARGLARGLEMGIAGIGTGVRSILDNRNEAAMLRAAMEEEDDGRQLVGGENAPGQGLPGGTPEGPDQGSGEGGAGMNAETFKREATQTKALRDYNHTTFGLSKDKLSTMGLSELRGTMRRMEMKQAHQEGLERSLFRRAQIAGLADSLMGAQEQRANSARFPDFARSLTDATAPSVGQMQDFYEGPPGLGNAGMPDESQRPQSRPITPRDFFQSLQSSGYNPGNETDSILRSIEAGNERNGRAGFFTPDQVGRGLPVTGPDGRPIPGFYTTPTGPNTSQLFTDPTQPQRPGAEKPGDEGSIEIPDQQDPVFGPRIRIPVSVAREKYPHLLKRLEAPGGSPSPGGEGGKAKPAAATPKDKAAQANQLARENPQWTRQQVLDELNRRMNP